MRQTFIIILSLMIGLAVHSQKDSIRGKQFRLTGTLIDKVQMTSFCGDIAWGTVVEFEVIDLVGMIYKNKKIGIIFTCPRDLYKEGFFEKGKTYQVLFSDTNQANFGWAIPNRNLLKKNNLSFDTYAITIKKVL